MGRVARHGGEDMTDHRDEHETYGHTHSPVIENLRKQVATLLDEQTGFRVAISTLTAERDEARADAERWEDDALRLLNERNAAQRERDEARRSCCEFAAMVDSADTVLMYVDSNRFHEIAMRYMKSRGWDCYKEDGK